MIRRARPQQSTKARTGAASTPERGPHLEAGGPDFVLYGMPGHLIRRLQQVAVSLFVDEAMKAGFDITPVQYAALMAVRTYPRIDQASLAGVIAYDRTTIGGVIDRLEGKGLVRRTTSASDRRLRQLVLEPEGELLLNKLAGSVRRAQERILEPLAPRKQKEFMVLLSRLVVENNERSRAPMRPVARERRSVIEVG